MAEIVLVTAGHVSTSPRVVREADVLTNAGHAVSVLGATLNARFADEDTRVATRGGWQWQPVLDLRRLTALPWRFKRRRAVQRVALGTLDPHAWSYAADALAAALSARPRAYPVLHLEVGLWLTEALRRAGRPYGVDVEDWYSENRTDLSPNSPERQMLSAMLGDALRSAAHATTTSHALAAALASAYTTAPPGVVYNGDHAPVQAAAPADGPTRLLWFSQTIGAGRGLETLCDALGQLGAPDDWTVTLVGQCSVAERARLLARMSSAWQSRVQWPGWLSASALAQTVASHHAGLALEPVVPRNKDLTTSNKILTYLQAGLAVCATSTAGQREALHGLPGTHALIPPDDATALAAALLAVRRRRAEHAVYQGSLRAAADARVGRAAQTEALLAAVHRGLHS